MKKQREFQWQKRAFFSSDEQDDKDDKKDDTDDEKVDKGDEKVKRDKT